MVIDIEKGVSNQDVVEKIITEGYLGDNQAQINESLVALGCEISSIIQDDSRGDVISVTKL